MEETVKSVDIAFIYILGFSLLFLTFITILMIVFVIRYRRSKNPVAEDIRGNWKLETLWMVIPLIIALTMFYFGWSSYTNLRGVPKGAMEIDVLGVQYAWIFTYPNGKESEGLLMVPRGKPVKLNITSDDVIHSLFIPAFRIKVDAVPGMNSYGWFYADKIGTYTILCAEYCGIDHSYMGATLRIVSEEEYQKWLDK